jgi:predicted permease
MLRPTLVALQVGLAVLLLVATGLIGRTLLTVRSLDLGFDPTRVLTFGTDESRLSRYRDLTATLQFRQDLTASLLRLPIFEAAGVGAVPLFNKVSDSFRIEEGTTSIDGNVNVPSPGYFRALRIRLVSGRLLEEADDQSAAKVVVVNRTFARRAWRDSDAVGRRVRYDMESSPWMTVVGVVEDQRMSELEAEPPAMVFIPYRQSTMLSIPNFVVRTKGDPAAAIPLVREAVHRLDPAVSVSRVATMDERYHRVIAPREFNLWLVGAFSLIALVLSAVGVYGLVNETVTSRTPEIGVRMALGSSSVQAVLLVLKSGVIATSIGVAAGLAVAVVLTRSIQSMLFGVTPLDPTSMIAAALTFVGVAALAALVPARRASRIDPLIALRSD